MVLDKKVVGIIMIGFSVALNVSLLVVFFEKYSNKRDQSECCCYPTSNINTKNQSSACIVTNIRYKAD
tara:strand:+ start:556 stop:759 length:204 start_codon:yes stop_codon:yes gene_type:complete